MLRGLVSCVIAILGLLLLLNNKTPGGDKKEYLSVKNIMRTAMKGGTNMLCTKVASGRATENERKQLILLFTHLAANKSPKGDAEDWKRRTSVLLEAAKSGDGKALEKAADCKGCHTTHR